MSTECVYCNNLFVLIERWITERNIITLAGIVDIEIMYMLLLYFSSTGRDDFIFCADRLVSILISWVGKLNVFGTQNIDLLLNRELKLHSYNR